MTRILERRVKTLEDLLGVGGTVLTATAAEINTVADGILATADEINRVADVSTRLVTLTGDTAIALATHEGKTLLLGEVGGNALLTATLPAATGSGAKYRFVVSVVNTSNYVIAVTGDDTFMGNVFANSTGDTPDLGQPWITAAGNNKITLNGTTTGGAQIGDWIEVQDILADVWMVRGITTASGAEATPFSTV